jgi:hypothetical protein
MRAYHLIHAEMNDIIEQVPGQGSGSFPFQRILIMNGLLV